MNQALPEKELLDYQQNYHIQNPYLNALALAETLKLRGRNRKVESSLPCLAAAPFLMRSLHTAYPAVDLAEKPRIGV